MKQEWKPLCDLSLIHPIAYHGAVVLNDVSLKQQRSLGLEDIVRVVGHSKRMRDF